MLLRLDGRRCVVVGGDAAAAAKAATLRDAGAVVTMVTSEPGPEAAALLAGGGVRHVARSYAAGDLAGALLAYASTTDPALVARLVDEAERERVLLNVIDVPDACSAVSPAVVRRGELTIAIGTGGASPALSARLRAELDGCYGHEWGLYVEILGAARTWLRGRADRSAIATALVDSPLRELVRCGDAPAIDRLLADLIDPAVSLDVLGVAIRSPEVPA